MKTFTVTATNGSKVWQRKVVAHTLRQAAFKYKRHNPNYKIVGIRLTTP